MGLSRDKVVVGLLAGGRSRRFGRDKLALQVHGLPLLHHLVFRVQRAGFRVVILGQPVGVEPPAGVPTLPDRLPGHGPLGGLHTLLSMLAPDQRGFLLPADLPFFDPALIEAMRSHLHASDSALLLLDAHGPQPACGFYAPACLPVLEDCLNRNDNIIWALLNRVPYRLLPVSELLPNADPHLLFNLNRPEDEALFWRLVDDREPLFRYTPAKRTHTTG